MKLSIWKKPGTDQIRIYFNGSGGGDGTVFAIEQDVGFAIKFSARGYPSQQDAIMDRIDMALADLNGGERVATWQELIKIWREQS